MSHPLSYETSINLGKTSTPPWRGAPAPSAPPRPFDRSGGLLGGVDEIGTAAEAGSGGGSSHGATGMEGGDARG